MDVDAIEQEAAPVVAGSSGSTGSNNAELEGATEEDEGEDEGMASDSDEEDEEEEEERGDALADDAMLDGNEAAARTSIIERLYDTFRRGGAAVTRQSIIVSLSNLYIRSWARLRRISENPSAATRADILAAFGDDAQRSRTNVLYVRHMNPPAEVEAAVQDFVRRARSGWDDIRKAASRTGHPYRLYAGKTEVNIHQRLASDWGGRAQGRMYVILYYKAAEDILQVRLRWLPHLSCLVASVFGKLIRCLNRRSVLEMTERIA